MRGMRRFFAVCVIFLAFGVGQLFAQGGSERNRPEPAAQRTLQVTGTGTVYGKPDIADLKLGVENRSADVKTAIQRTTGQMDKLISALASAGVQQQDIATSSYNISFIPEQGSTGKTDNNGQSGIYRVSDVATVTVRNLDQLGTIMDRALSAGANRVDGVAFSISTPGPLEKRARELAYQEAHQRAVQLAKLSGVSIEHVLNIVDTGPNGPTETPVYRASSFAGAPPINPGELSVRVTVQVTYQIQ